MIRVEYHNGVSFPQSEIPVNIDRLRDMQRKSPSGVQPFTNLRIEGKATVADVPAPNERGSFVLISRTIPNFIELDSAKFEKHSTEEGLEQVVAWRREHGEAQKPGREIYSKVC
ncbi:MAG: hypothetical protein JOZ45_02420 [Acidobacteriaceae bacterium]|nr:hypothetical protein [Acidobacteriaceae bacterium]